MARSPATTWAFVTITPGATSTPLPSWMTSHERPSTFTTAFPTGVTSAAGIPWPGGAPTSDAVRLRNTSGNGPAPTRRPSVARVDGGDGATVSISRTIAEPRTARAGHPGALASPGIRSHTMTRTPRMPATAPASRSAVRNPPTRGRWRCRTDPIANPTACPATARTSRKASDAMRRVWGVEPCRVRATLSTNSAPTTRPSASPTHDSARAANPNRYPEYAASSSTATRNRSSRFTRPC